MAMLITLTVRIALNSLERVQTRDGRTQTSTVDKPIRTQINCKADDHLFGIGTLWGRPPCGSLCVTNKCKGFQMCWWHVSSLIVSQQDPFTQYLEFEHPSKPNTKQYHVFLKLVCRFLVVYAWKLVCREWKIIGSPCKRDVTSQGFFTKWSWPHDIG